MLSKRGPLARVWLAAHVERKVSKAQTLQTSIPTTVTVILEPASTTLSAPPLALRLSGQLLLGIARIYSKQAKYLLEDCNEASDKIRAAFRSDVLQAMVHDTIGDDHLFMQSNLNAPNRDAINLRTAAHRKLFEFELEFGDGLGYGLGDGWEDIDQLTGDNDMIIPSSTRRSRIDADVGEITLAEHQAAIQVGERSDLGLDDLAQEDVGLMGDGDGFDLGLDVEGLDSEIKQPKKQRQPRGSSVADDTIEMEIGRDAPGTADRRSARESLPAPFGDVTMEKTFDISSAAGDISFGIETGEPGFEPTRIGSDLGEGLAVGPEFELGLGQPIDLGLGGDNQDVMMDQPAPPEGEDGQATPRATTPAPNPLLEHLDVTPRTSHHLAPNLHSPADPSAGVDVPAPKRKKKHQLVDRVTELEPVDHLSSSLSTVPNLPTNLPQSRFLPKDRYQLQHYRLSLDPSQHEFLPKLLEVNGQKWLMAAPAGLCKELQELFRFPAKASASSAQRGTKRARTELEAEEIESEHGRRAPSVLAEGLDFSRNENPDETFDLGDVTRGEEAGGIFGEDDGFQFELQPELDIPGESPARKKARSSSTDQLEVTPEIRRVRAEGEFSKLDIFDEPGDSQTLSQAVEVLESTGTVGERTKWSKNTIKALKVLKDEFNEIPNGVIKFKQTSQSANRKATSAFFFELLVLSTRNCLKPRSSSAGDLSTSTNRVDIVGWPISRLSSIRSKWTKLTVLKRLANRAARKNQLSRILEIHQLICWSLTNGKPPLSVQIITLNFKNFVSKSGPLFKLQNAVEDIFVWRNPPKTIACACLWAWLSIYPVFFLLIPNLIIIWILLSTHSQRYPHGMANDPKVDALSGKDVSDEPIEGSPDYISNMHHIQNLMGDISAGSDFVKSNILCYLDWSDPHHSLIILHLAVLSSIPLVLFGPMIPWRFVMLFGGESIFLATHPWTQAWIEQFKLNLEETLIHQQA
ncbi:hypothetical protein O181_053873 [Austropuccinia psidii MF-1]|uniref:Rad21/Rec8-like protein N-terminal domain-containing protein n=1 Tax=Austropuccinia psidii MF-1 TaxID=1389203 RepID=A0A9Q3E568_9BASI|nr:hypothetical protein [Austropuccinia psidii MF-1]